jgi:copper chaperone
MIQRAILNVNGMSCTGCENAIKRVLKQVPGVDEVVASHKDGTVDVTYEADQATPATFKQKVEGLGYQVVGGTSSE